MSASVSSTVPALFIVPITAVSPSWMLRRVTMPSIGRLDADLAQVVAGALEAGALLLDAGFLRADLLLALLERRLAPT